ncbi:hypothetical protein JW949_00110 [Candidatus Woesearchaeota archaeon]|nr:hypothetical protein [Candidatus Woesearchaeota archaeon]
MWGKNEKELNVPKEIPELAQDKYEHSELNLSENRNNNSSDINVPETKKGDNADHGLKEIEDKILSETEKKKIFSEVSAEKLYNDKAEEKPVKEEQKMKPASAEELKENLPEVREPEPMPKIHPTHRRILPFHSKEPSKEYSDYIEPYSYTGKTQQQGEFFHDGLSDSNKPKESPLSFFDNLSRFFRKKDMDKESESTLKRLLDDDLLQKMKSFHTWELEDNESYFLFEKENLKRALQKKLSELKSLEERWYIVKERLVNEEHMLKKEESQINFKLDELKSIMKKLVDEKQKENNVKESMQKEASEEGYFILRSKNGVAGVLKSIDDLKEKLPSVPDEVFNYHVNENRNDFADWIENVFNAAETASKLRVLKSKKEFIEFFS